MRRYAALVWGVCRRRLARREDAEDAFQATFLILAVKAGSVRAGEALPGWLHRAACRASIRVASAPPGREREETPAPGLDALAELARREASVAVDEELVRLPGRYREPLVLFHLERLERQEVADRLGLSEPAVKALLARGRSLLRSRLARRGFALPMVMPFLADPLPAEAAANACRLAGSFARSGLSPFDLVASPVKGWGPMFTSVTGKTAAVAVAGAVGITLLLAVNGPAEDGGGGAAKENVPDTIVHADAVSETGDVALARADEPKKAAGPDRGAAAGAGTDASRKDAQVNSSAEREIAAALDQEANLKFPQMPLRNAIQFIAEKHKINIVIDEKAATDEGVNIDDNVDLFKSGVTLRSALDFMLKTLDLTYTIKDEVLLVTTAERARREVDIRAYGVGPLLEGRGAGDLELAATITKLLEAEPTTDSPLKDGEGGALPARPKPQVVTYKGRLIVTASWEDHRRIAEILRLMSQEP